jgi:hypothetical protein
MLTFKMPVYHPLCQMIFLGGTFVLPMPVQRVRGLGQPSPVIFLRCHLDLRASAS